MTIVNLQPLDLVGLLSYGIALLLSLMIARDLWRVWTTTERQISRDFTIISLAWALWAVTGFIGLIMNMMGATRDILMAWGTVVRLTNLAMVAYAFYTIRIKK